MIAVEAAGGVVLRDGDDGVEVLVVHRPRHPDWSLPKGKLDPGEDHPTAARREVAEETGVDAEVGVELPEVRYDVASGRKRVRWYLMHLRADGTDDRRPDAEVDDVRWVPVDEADGLLTYDHDRTTLAAALGAHR